ncbi:cytochrome-c peroxidase [Phaeocystidibacter marisrubri]|uniref:Cytochrome c domain-containing protein n=1 Tax=Phaeocystidibacter marisrubri TaxID=1577780 RepID=A0A6L3ZHJ5_9FLAO|nr:cytochrome c peroxidase [Phaeocystidibacter marisrubri]KAB2817331.1 hypothetical protein F8C82_02765 [Phaeocystidibacter marisrubri]GGH75879.1 cytochrome-c peroxidase [Phaeocystidibacter marisrubri]
MKRLLFTAFGSALLIIGCSEPTPDAFQVSLPTHIPPVPWPESAPTVAEVELGEALFHSTQLSLNREISCASCHLPSHAFSDTSSVSLGIHRQSGFRNTPSIFNVAWKEHFFMEGGVDRLERATLGPMLVEEEMSLQAPELMKRLREDIVFHEKFVAVYGESYDYANVVDALSAFQRSAISVDSKWDAVQEGIEEFLDDEALGLALFESDSLACSSCHKPPFFKDGDFHDVGMPIGEDPDFGRGRFTFDTTDYYSFSTPSLRNVELTAPYMHDGSISTLDSVIRFYEAGGVRESEISAFTLQDEHRSALISFLKSLSGREAKRAYKE